MIYFTGCTHFGHYNIIKMAKRPFQTVEEMDEALIENWNKTVKPKDTIYHLGDFCFKNSAAMKEYIDRLNGTLVPVNGNHDPKNWGKHYREIKFNKTKFVLCHYPIEEWNGWYNNAIHLHCHTHKPNFHSAERRSNVGVDACNFKPISIEEVVEKLK